MLDGHYHTFHLKYTQTERTLSFDNITYIQRDDVHNNIIQHRAYPISTVWGSDVQHATNATIKNLCINPKINAISTTMQTDPPDTTNRDNVRAMSTPHVLTTDTEHTDVTVNAREMSSSTVPDVSKTTETSAENTEDGVGMWLIMLLISIGLIAATCWLVRKGCKGDTESESEVEEWLTMIGLERYFDTFRRNGLTSLEFIGKIRDENDLQNIGIDLKGHQIVIMAEIEKLKTLNETGNDDTGEGMTHDTYVEGHAATDDNVNVKLITSGDHSEA
eukprot:102370_1